MIGSLNMNECFVIVNVLSGNPVSFTFNEKVASEIVNENNKTCGSNQWFYKKVVKVPDWKEKLLTENKNERV